MQLLQWFLWDWANVIHESKPVINYVAILFFIFKVRLQRVGTIFAPAILKYTNTGKNLTTNQYVHFYSLFLIIRQIKLFTLADVLNSILVSQNTEGQHVMLFSCGLPLPQYSYGEN